MIRFAKIFSVVAAIAALTLSPHFVQPSNALSTMAKMRHMSGVKMTHVKAHTRVMKSGKIIHVKAHSRMMPAKKMVKVHAYNKMVGGKMVHVKAHSRMMAHPKMHGMKKM